MTDSGRQFAASLRDPEVAPEVAVIIPYYQKDPHILERSVGSIFSQHGSPSLHVIIVDDGSPAPVEPELINLDPVSRKSMTIIRQKNQGPGPARNTGLSAVSGATKYIAFLDSDDVWHEHHLSLAISMMDKGFDFYFADGDLEGGQSSLFQTTQFNDSTHPVCLGDQPLFEYKESFLSLLLDRSPVITSTVVIRRSRLGSIRFPESPGICEDLLYWLYVAQEVPRVAFGRTIDVTGGSKGVHMSHRGVWKSNKSLRNIYDFDQYYSHVLTRIPLSSVQRDRILQQSSSNRMDFLTTAAAMLKAGKMPSLRLVRDFVVSNPHLIRDVISYARSSRKRL